jgi:hypothetical protein
MPDGRRCRCRRTGAAIPASPLGRAAAVPPPVRAPGPGDGQRLFVTLDGIFYQADVWLDGAYLGDPEGYFFAHSFDVTNLMRLGDEHVLAVEATCSRRRTSTAKRSITGSFQHSRSIDPSWNPAASGVPVRLRTTGAVRIDRCRVLCRDANDARAHLRSPRASTATRPRRARADAGRRGDARPPAPLAR